MVDQLNASLSIAAHKIDELSQERDLLLADKALLTQAVITRITLLCPQFFVVVVVGDAGDNEEDDARSHVEIIKNV